MRWQMLAEASKFAEINLLTINGTVVRLPHVEGRKLRDSCILRHVPIRIKFEIGINLSNI